MALVDIIAKENPLVETIARAIFEERYKGRRWDQAKVRDQWLALGTFNEAKAVYRVVPLRLDTRP